MPVLQVENLIVEFPTRGGWLRATDGVSFSISSREAFALVGESGSGKTVTSLAIMGLLPPTARIVSGRILLSGEDLLQMQESEWRKVRGRRIGMVYQEPMTSLNPAFTIGEQIAEVYRHQLHLSRGEAKGRTIEMLERVKLPRAQDMYRKYPHEFSGGMRQRVIIAMALACGPDLLIADEPTTALDVTIQAQIVALLQELQRDLGMALLFISHDLGIVAQLCQRVAVMYAARIVELAPTRTLFEGPAHHYSAGLLGSIPVRGKLLHTIPGNPCELLDPPPGCRFHPRCSHAQELCQQTVPPLQSLDERDRLRTQRLVACHFPVQRLEEE